MKRARREEDMHPFYEEHSRKCFHYGPGSWFEMKPNQTGHVEYARPNYHTENINITKNLRNSSEYKAWVKSFWMQTLSDANFGRGCTTNGFICDEEWQRKAYEEANWEHRYCLEENRPRESEFYRACCEDKIAKGKKIVSGEFVDMKSDKQLPRGEEEHKFEAVNAQVNEPINERRFSSKLNPENFSIRKLTESVETNSKKKEEHDENKSEEFMENNNSTKMKVKSSKTAKVPNERSVRGERNDSLESVQRYRSSSAEIRQPDPDLSEQSENNQLKPPYSYIALISMAILEAPKKCLTLSDILEYIQRCFPYFRNCPSKGWKASIRHNLSLNDCFVKTYRDPCNPSKGHLWALHPDSARMFEGGSYMRRRKRFRVNNVDGNDTVFCQRRKSQEVDIKDEEKFLCDSGASPVPEHYVPSSDFIPPYRLPFVRPPDFSSPHSSQSFLSQPSLYNFPYITTSSREHSNIHFPVLHGF